MNENELKQLAELLVRYHSFICQANEGIYGWKMERALVHDTFTTLFRYIPNKLNNLSKQINQ